jgi:hypothetical protein
LYAQDELFAELHLNGVEPARKSAVVDSVARALLSFQSGFADTEDVLQSLLSGTPVTRQTILQNFVRHLDQVVGALTLPSTACRTLISKEESKVLYRIREEDKTDKVIATLWRESPAGPLAEVRSAKAANMTDAPPALLTVDDGAMLGSLADPTQASPGSTTEIEEDCSAGVGRLRHRVLRVDGLNVVRHESARLAMYLRRNAVLKSREGGLEYPVAPCFVYRTGTTMLPSYFTPLIVCRSNVSLYDNDFVEPRSVAEHVIELLTQLLLRQAGVKEHLSPEQPVRRVRIQVRYTFDAWTSTRRRYLGEPAEGTTIATPVALLPPLKVSLYEALHQGRVEEPPPGAAKSIGDQYSLKNVAEAIQKSVAEWKDQQPHPLDNPTARLIFDVTLFESLNVDGNKPVLQLCNVSVPWTNKIVAAAKKYADEGQVFRKGCVDMVRSAYAEGGISIPENYTANDIINTYKPVGGMPLPGDIAGWTDSPVGHVVIYLGPNLFANCPGPDSATQYDAQMGHLLTYRRPVRTDASAHRPTM